MKQQTLLERTEMESTSMRRNDDDDADNDNDNKSNVDGERRERRQRSQRKFPAQMPRLADGYLKPQYLFASVLSPKTGRKSAR